MTNPLEQIRDYMSSRVVASIRDRSKGVGVKVGSDIHLAEMLLAKIDAILDASQGYVCVPVEPTKAMLDAFFEPDMDIGLGGYIQPAEMYKAMLAASPPPPKEK